MLSIGGAMFKKINFLWIGLALGFGLGCGTRHESPAPAQSQAADFSAFVDDYFKAFFDFSPTNGTAAGLHQYDTMLDNLSSEAIACEDSVPERFQGSPRWLARPSSQPDRFHRC